MAQDDIRDVLRETGRGMSLEELARITGLAKTTVLRNVNTLWRRHECSRMYRVDELTNIRYVYYFFGGNKDGDNSMKYTRRKEVKCEIKRN